MRALLTTLTLLLVLGCASVPDWKRVPHDRLWQRAPEPVLHPEPKHWEPSGWYETLEASTTAQLGRALSPGFYLETGGHARPALDVNAFGKVADSVWFENRIGRQRLSAEQVGRGSALEAGPALARLRVKSSKTAGITPGLVVEDAAGVRWMVKLDPIDHPGLASGAEAIATRLLWAAGYHVPDNRVVTFDPRVVELAPGASSEDRYGRKVALESGELDALLDRYSPRRAQPIRALFSRFLPGKPIGPFPLTGTRPDDPNDRLPHERRRSLRGLRWFYAWLNNVDAKVAQSFDAFIEVDSAAGLGFVRHYLIDFGSALGSAGDRPKTPGGGHDYEIDWGRAVQRFAGAGIYEPYYKPLESVRPRLRSVGLFESAVFDPARWRPMRPHPIFELSDAEDTFWAASILARFERQQIAAAVRAAAYEEPGAAEHVARVLLERRNKILRHAFAGLAPLDDPAVVRGTRVTLIDLELAAGLRAASGVGYRFRLEHAGRPVARAELARPSIDLGAAMRFLEPELARDPFLTLRVSRVQAGSAGPQVVVRLRAIGSERLLPVALERQRIRG
jgi:hypothetical protein